MGINKQISRYEFTAVYTHPDAKVDVVLVHGLNGDPKSSWSAKNGVFWPADLLPESLRNERANILVYGYNADVWSSRNDRSSSDNFIHQHAQTLVTTFTHYRRSEGSVSNPIIWLAHSLGGILTKRALLYSNDLQSDHAEDYRSIYVSTYGIIFLGTPHGGSDLATWGRVVQMMSEAVVPRKVFETESVLLRALKRDSETLQTINNHFLDIYQRFQIHMAHENHKTDLRGKRMMVVDSSSASPQLPGVTYYGIETSHSGLSKFDGPNAPGYVTVSTAIREWVRAAPPVIGMRWEVEEGERRRRVKFQNLERSRIYTRDLTRNLMLESSEARFLFYPEPFRSDWYFVGQKGELGYDWRDANDLGRDGDLHGDGVPSWQRRPYSQVSGDTKPVPWHVPYPRTETLMPALPDLDEDDGSAGAISPGRPQVQALQHQELCPENIGSPNTTGIPLFESDEVQSPHCLTRRPSLDRHGMWRETMIGPVRASISPEHAGGLIAVLGNSVRAGTRDAPGQASHSHAAAQSEAENTLLAIKQNLVPYHDLEIDARRVIDREARHSVDIGSLAHPRTCADPSTSGALRTHGELLPRRFSIRTSPATGSLRGWTGATWSRLKEQFIAVRGSAQQPPPPVVPIVVVPEGNRGTSSGPTNCGTDVRRERDMKIRGASPSFLGLSASAPQGFLYRSSSPVSGQHTIAPHGRRRRSLGNQVPAASDTLDDR